MKVKLMYILNHSRRYTSCGALVRFTTTLLLAAGIANAGEPDNNIEPIDYLTFAQGAIPVAITGSGVELGVDFEHALKSIDGNSQPFLLFPKPGRDDADVEFIYELPANTTFTRLAVPKARQTPSPAQTFIKNVEVFGSATSAEGDYELLASGEPFTNKTTSEIIELLINKQVPVRWVKLRLSGGINMRRKKSFLEFSEIIGYGSQEPVPRIDRFTGKWKGSGVLLELTQKSATVTGCYDNTGDLSGTVTGNILHATGVDRQDGTPSIFVLTVTPDKILRGVRSSNGAPFKLYTSPPTPAGTVNGCSKPESQKLGCGSIVHGIYFGYDSATLRPGSEPILADLFDGLASSPDTDIVIEGHTSSEGDVRYNQELSEHRAQSIVEDLVTRGVTADRISATGKGESKPIASNTDEAGRSMNRRVEVKCK